MYSEDMDTSRFNDLVNRAKKYYLDNSYPPNAAHQYAVQAVENATAYLQEKPSERAGRGDRFAKDSFLYDGSPRGSLSQRFTEERDYTRYAAPPLWRSSGRGYDGYGLGRDQASSRDDYVVCDPGFQERYNTLPYHHAGRKLDDIAEKIEDECVKKGASREEARVVANWWYIRKLARWTGPSSGFDSGLADHEGRSRREDTSRGARAGKSRTSGPGMSQFDWDFAGEPEENGGGGRGARGYRTEERRPGGSAGNGFSHGRFRDDSFGVKAEDGSRYSSRGGPRGYHTEERRPGGYRTEERRDRHAGEHGSTGSESPPVEDPRHSSRHNERTKERRHGGYRTEERRPRGFSPESDSGYGTRDDEPSGVKPDVELYKVLGVSKSATADEIKAAHRKLCIKHHPDRVQGGPAANKAATETMAQINQAADVLKDEKMRAFYDRTGLMASMGESPDA